ncbi:DUF6973 domain-containing protein [Paenibacillus sp. 481]|uniref:DUF6973 domain-containing protein n=1 Tax=Paenibacillus sp. 481 TaxID=2835869 RepID=UPI001E463BF5|nr:hypothetical protein [Paenibacillus sp. 481]UHA75147.1 hypothetical protein KIK04_09045 [Paenibacillus sp. 481]
MKKTLLFKTTLLSVLSFSLLLPGASFANAYGTIDGGTAYASFNSNSKKSSPAELNHMKNEIKMLLEENKSGSSQSLDRMSPYMTQSDIQFIHNIIELKKANPQLSTEELSNIVFPVRSGVASLRSISSGWAALNAAEKSLAIEYPAQALIVNLAKTNTDKITRDQYPGWIDGDKGNAFRHALWNAIMSVTIGKDLAEKFATAHENNGLTIVQQLAQSWHGFNGIEHKSMDMHNNLKGRDCVKTSEFLSSVTNTELAKRVQKKIDNNELIILVK